MPRLFVALEVAHDAAMMMTLMRGGLSGARWIDAEHYHLTLRFVGDIDAPLADALADSLETVRQPAFSLGFSGLGVFGGNKPRTLYATPDTVGTTLNDLQGDIDRRCKRLGLAADKRKFAPHVTLARLKGSSPEAVANFISLRGGFCVPPSQVTSFVLMSSRDSIGGGPYLVEGRYPLAMPDAASSLSINATEAVLMSR